jgi:hypothetical protein
MPSVPCSLRTVSPCSSVWLLGLAALALPLAAAAAPTPPPPPPLPAQGYPPPPPRFHGVGQPPPFDYPFEEGPGGTPAVARPAFEGIYRPLSFTASVGPGALFGPGENEFALSYQLFRLGVGLDENLAAVFGYESTGTDSVNPATNEDSWLKQDIWSLGLQAHLERRLYFRGTMGLGYVSEKTASAKFSGGRGVSVATAVGYELLQYSHLALALDVHGSYTHYPRESWKTLGLQLAVSVF